MLSHMERLLTLLTSGSPWLTLSVLLLLVIVLALLGIPDNGQSLLDGR
jgi:hypothetical protein